MSVAHAAAVPAEATPGPARKQRVVSLDAARAIVVALMIFMDHPMIAAALPTFLVFAFCQNLIIRGIVVPTEK